MIITREVELEVELSEIDFRSSAKKFTELLTENEKETLESIFADMYPDGIHEARLNDIFCHNQCWIAELLNTTDDEIYARDL